MKSFFKFLKEQAEDSCPVPAKDLKVNTKNRDAEKANDIASDMFRGEYKNNAGATETMRFEQFMENANEVFTVYHGDNHGTRSLDPRLMNHGNNQEGIGIYFSDRIETARDYGRHVVKAEINLRNFVNARAQLSTLSRNGIIRVLLDMKKVDAESMYYLVTDFGVFLTEPEELEDRHVEEIFSLISAGEIRNFQIEMAEAFGVEEFVRSWNRHVKIDGTFNNNSPTEIWFAIINPDIKVTPVP